MKIGFIGLGNMATASIGGILKKEMVQSKNIIGFDALPSAIEKAKSGFNITGAIDNKQVAREADVLFLAVKPIFLEDVLTEIKDVISADTIIISIYHIGNLPIIIHCKEILHFCKVVKSWLK